jgi:hypothetical protein
MKERFYITVDRQIKGQLKMYNKSLLKKYLGCNSWSADINMYLRERLNKLRYLERVELEKESNEAVQ